MGKISTIVTLGFGSFFFVQSVTTLVASDTHGFQGKNCEKSVTTQDVVEAIVNEQPYPQGPITAENHWFHLRGFPTFVEITQAGVNLLSKEREENAFTIDFFANFDSQGGSCTLYSININFFGRLKAPGIYQPDYMPFVDNTYMFGYSGVIQKDSQFISELKKRRHAIITFLDGTDYYGSEVGFGGNGIPPSSSLLSLGGQLLWGETPIANGSSNFGTVQYRQGLRGVVFVMDAVLTNGASKWTTRIREVTEGDLAVMRASGELKIPIK